MLWRVNQYEECVMSYLYLNVCWELAAECTHQRRTLGDDEGAEVQQLRDAARQPLRRAGLLAEILVHGLGPDDAVGVHDDDHVAALIKELLNGISDYFDIFSQEICCLVRAGAVGRLHRAFSIKAGYGEVVADEVEVALIVPAAMDEEDHRLSFGFGFAGHEECLRLVLCGFVLRV